MTNMNKLDLDNLQIDIATWETLVKVDDQTGHLINDYFDIASYGDLKQKCPNSIQIRGHPFHNCRTLSDLVLNDFLLKLSIGLTKLADSNDVESTHTLLQQIANRDPTVFAAISESRQDMPDTELLQTIRTNVDVQMNELKMLSVKYVNWTLYLRVYNKTLDDMDHLKRLLTITTTESSIGMVDEINNHLEMVGEAVSLIEHRVGTLLQDEYLYTGFRVNQDEKFTHQALEQTLTGDGRTFPNLCLLGFAKREGSLRTSLAPELKEIYLDIKTRISLWKGEHAQNPTDITTSPSASALVAQPAMSVAPTSPRHVTTVTPSTSGALSTIAPPYGLPSISRSIGGNLFEALDRLPEVYQNHRERRGTNIIFDNVTTRDRLNNRTYSNSGRARSPVNDRENNREVNKDYIKINKFNEKMSTFHQDMLTMKFEKLEIAECRVFIKRLGGLQLLLSHVEQTGLEPELVREMTADDYLNKLSIELERKLNLITETTAEAKRIKENALKRMPACKLQKLGTKMDFLSWAPAISELEDKVGKHDPSFRQAVVDSLEDSADIEHCRNILDINVILGYIMGKYLSIEGITGIVRKKIGNLKRPVSPAESLSNITDILKLVDTLKLNSVLFILDDTQVGFLEAKSFTIEDLVVYKKLEQKHFTSSNVIPESGDINIRALTAAVLQGSRENTKRDYLLKYLKDHLTVLQNIANVQGLRVNKEHGRRVDEQSKLEQFEDDSYLDGSVEKAFRANISK